MVNTEERAVRRKVMSSSPTSSTSSAYASTDDGRRYYDNDKSNFLESDSSGTARLLRSYTTRARVGRFCSLLRGVKTYLRSRSVTVFAILVIIAFLIIVGVSIFGGKAADNDEETKLFPPDPEVVLPPSYSELRTFRRAAVCADGAPCAVIGKSILERNGSAVDAALASMICNGLVNMQSMGFGGGFVMAIYERANKKAYALNARDRAPFAADSTMFDGKPPEASLIGPLTIAVPGELAGYWEAHKRFGKLSWADLFAPTIDLCENGYNLTKIQHDGFQYNQKNIYNDPILKSLFVDPNTNDFYKPGKIIRPTVLCKTLRTIAQNNATEFYNGSLGKTLVEDLRAKGSIITMKDLNEYKASWDDPLQTNISDSITVYTVGSPASGEILTYIMNIFDDFQFTPESISDLNSTTLTYHRMAEAYKYAYALRNDLGDKDFVNISELVKNLTSKEFAHATRLKITDDRTWENPQHYGFSMKYNPDDHGTAHISVLAPNGDAVSATSTINFYFGSGVVSERTGILMNNAMNDFGIPSTNNYFGVPPSPTNYIEPGKRPLSSMAPSIFVDANGDVKMVVGASGGTKITTTLSQVIAKILWMEKTVKEAVDAPRIHHQLIPNEISYEYGIPKQVIKGLKGLGHKMTRYRTRGSVACIILVDNGTIYANADFRKGGDVYGLD